MKFAAVDLGASSGRVIVGELRDGVMRMDEVSRFVNGAVALPENGGAELYWDVLALWQNVTRGLREAERKHGPLSSVGIDTWAVDYGLLGPDGALVGNPISHRSSRTDGRAEQLFDLITPERLFQMNGLQVIPLNTIFQLMAESPRRLGSAEALLLMPDLLGAWLTGAAVAEVTNASTTGLMDPSTRCWNEALVALVSERLGVDLLPLLPAPFEPGAVMGPIELDGVTPGTPLVAVGSHDTASAVVAVPASDQEFAFISCGTWSLLGTELMEPVLTEHARAENFTNELGVDGTVRFLKNVMGLWVQNEAMRTWREQGDDISIVDLTQQAGLEEPRRTVIDIDDMRLYAPGDMAHRISEIAREGGQSVPTTKPQVIRCILDSLAAAYTKQLQALERVTGASFETIHMVGGGTQNELLCQLTADATGRRVVAGPVEGTALGNLLIQARTMGALDGGLVDLRDVARRSTDLRTFEPNR